MVFNCAGVTNMFRILMRVLTIIQ